MEDTAAARQPSRTGQLYRDGVTIAIVAAFLSLLLWRPGSRLLEVLTTLALLLVLSTFVQIASPLARRAEAASNWIARKRFAVVLVGIFGLAVASSLSLLSQFPQPQITDEFSNLLAADTFAHGRLTNPTHPMWIHFETLNVLQTPSYMSKFPPAQGAILAVGQLVGSPAVGIWLSTGVACAAVFWMLKQWAAPRWALVGAVATAIHPQMLEWSHNYWGGQIAMAGGALTIGAFRRLMNGPKTRDGIVAGLGMATLANIRPYEGLVLAICLGAFWVIWVRIGKQFGWAAVFKRFVLPASAVLLLAGLGMGLYNYRVTGNPLRMPYMAYGDVQSCAAVHMAQCATCSTI